MICLLEFGFVDIGSFVGSELENFNELVYFFAGKLYLILTFVFSVLEKSKTMVYDYALVCCTGSIR